MKRYYPISLGVEGRKCVVVGGGEVAARKAKSLGDAGGRVTVVSPEFSQRLLRLAREANVALRRKCFRAGDLDGAFLTIACTDDRSVNDRVYAAAKRRGILVNVVDSVQQCDFIVPAVVSRGALTIAISTSGVSPALARRTRQELEERYDRKYTDFLELMERSRDRIVEKVEKARDRKRIFEALTSPEFLAEFSNKPKGEARRLFEARVKELVSRAQSDHV